MLSAAIGTGIGLIAERGPEGPAGKQGKEGKRGPQGPRGPEGESASGEVGDLEAEVEELRGRTEGLEESLGEGSPELEERIEGLEEEVEELGGITAELCSEVEFFC